MTARELYGRLLRDLRPAKKYLSLGLLLYFPVTILAVVQPLIIGYAVQHGFLNGQGDAVLSFAAIFLATVSLLAILELLQGLCLQITGQILVADLRKNAFSKMQRLSMGFLDSMPMGRILTRLTNDAESVVEMFSMGAVQIVGDMLFMVGTFIMLLFVDVKLALYSALILPLLTLGMYFFRKWTRKAYVRVREALSILNSYIQEYLSGIATVQISAQLTAAHHDFSVHNKNYLTANRQAIFLDAAIYSFVDALSYFAAALVLWGAFEQKLEHALALGTLVAFLESLSRFFQPVRELSNRYVIFQSALVSLERIYDMLTWPEEHDQQGKPTPHFTESVKFNDVSFSYVDGEPVLKNISFTLKKGERIALVGSTGAGKSTVVKLLNRFYPPTSGQIVIDDKDINEMSLSGTRRLISVVPQEVFLFKGTLKDNLNFGNANASDEELWRALEMVQLAPLVQKKGGLQAEVASKGHNFSLGERQLVAIARALVVNPPILLLDEATASVDSMTEKRLQHAIKNLLDNRTALVIAHRLSTILDADRILVFHRGEIVEEGNHDELMMKNGVYAGLIKIQETALVSA